MELFLNDKLGKITFEIDQVSEPEAVLIIAHGAGAGMHHPFMSNLAVRIVNEGISTIRFNFPYMEQGRKSPGSPKANIETWSMVLNHVAGIYPSLPLFLSGKSYGGRMASHLIAENSIEEVKGIIYYGFPLHAPGRDSTDRASHLTHITVPQMFIQGTKDKLANLELMKEVTSSLKDAQLEIIEEGDHSFNVPKRSGKTKDEILDLLAIKSATWIKNLVS
ncbi:alpha/beta family hydrolase [Ekhidna sp.]|uniref:alpha/beta hydrolase family protein n=1 Tax=Ekhidna sp. TaxID=2608089 RepID=UPI003299434D